MVSLSLRVWRFSTRVHRQEVWHTWAAAGMAYLSDGIVPFSYCTKLLINTVFYNSLKYSDCILQSRKPTLSHVNENSIKRDGRIIFMQSSGEPTF